MAALQQGERGAQAGNAGADNKRMLSQGRLKPRVQAAHSSNETVGRCIVELAANLSIESIMEKNIPSSGIQRALSLHRQPGFTLIELVVTLAIAAILLAVAVPNYIAFVQNSRLTNQANDFVTALNYARSEAIKRGVRTTVCSRATDDSCAGSTTWDAGWLVFVDCDFDGVVDGGNCPDWDGNGAADDEPVLLVRQPLESGNTLRATQRQRVTYQNTGYSGFADRFSLCDSRGTASGREITVNMQGRVSTTPVASSCP
jgi:type IV fimbrial biogenesis protein FimT